MIIHILLIIAAVGLSVLAVSYSERKRHLRDYMLAAARHLHDSEGSDQIFEDYLRVMKRYRFYGIPLQECGLPASPETFRLACARSLSRFIDRARSQHRRMTDRYDILAAAPASPENKEDLQALGPAILASTTRLEGLYSKLEKLESGDPMRHYRQFEERLWSTWKLAPRRT